MEGNKVQKRREGGMLNENVGQERSILNHKTESEQNGPGLCGKTIRRLQKCSMHTRP